MVSEEEFRKLPYRKQLEVLMEEARKEKDIWLMLEINDKMREHNREKKFPS